MSNFGNLKPAKTYLKFAKIDIFHQERTSYPWGEILINFAKSGSFQKNACGIGKQFKKLKSTKVFYLVSIVWLAIKKVIDLLSTVFPLRISAIICTYTGSYYLLENINVHYMTGIGYRKLTSSCSCLVSLSVYLPLRLVFCLSFVFAV